MDYQAKNTSIVSQDLSPLIFALRFHIVEHESIPFVLFLGYFGDSR